MFSAMIQNLLTSGGQRTIEQRAMQLQNYANNYNKPINTQTPQLPANMQNINLQGLQGMPNLQTGNVASFDQVLKNSSKTHFGALLTPISTKEVQAEAIQSQPSLNSYAKPTKSQILDMVSKISKKHGVDEKLVKAVIKQESGFNPQATSHCGAMGLMQLMPKTAKGLGVTDPYNPVQNVEGGVKYLKNLLKKYNGNVILSLAAYNAGSGAVDKYNGVPPYKETQNYVKNILANYL